MSQLPYIDRLLGLPRGDEEADALFGRHIHLGYWPTPASTPTSLAAAADAAEGLSRLVWGLAGVEPGMRVLDAGCGFGGTLASIDDACAGVRLWGLNLDLRQLRRAAATLAAKPGNRLGWVAGDACDSPFRDGCLDAMVAVECAFHFPTRAGFLRQARRQLKPGGRLALSDFVVSPVGGRRLPIPRRFRGRFYGTVDVGATLSDYIRWAEDAGLESLEQRDITANSLPTYSLLLRLMRRRRWWGPYVETWLLRWFIRAGGVRYMALSFRRPPRS